MGCYIWYSEEGPGWAAAPPSPLLAVPNVTAHPSTASVPITVLPYNGPLLCGFNVHNAHKGITNHSLVNTTDVIADELAIPHMSTVIIDVVFVVGKRDSMTEVSDADVTSSFVISDVAAS